MSPCASLSISQARGGPPEEARENCREALTLFISTCYVRGTLDRVLLDAGFMPGPDMEEQSVADEADCINVPPSLVAHAQVDAA